MICFMCGREVNDDSYICKGCGAQLKHADPVQKPKFSEQIKSEIKFGKSYMKTWQLCLTLFIMIGLVVGFYAAYPMLSSFVSDIISAKPENLSPAVDTTVTEIDKVSGEILVLNSKIANCVVQSETAYSDNTWEKSFLVNGSIVVKTLRYNKELNEDWINTYIFALYPDIQSVAAVTPAPSFSDCSAERIRISETSYASGCTVEVVRVETEKFNHIFIVEMPNELFDEYLAWINEWIDSLSVVDADVYFNSENL